MKKIFLFITLCFLNFSSYSQIDPFLGIYDLDSCQFENQCNFLSIDTSSQNVWQVGKPAKSFFEMAYSLPNALVTDTLKPYPNSNHSYFDLNLTTFYGFGLIVGFKHKFNTDTLSDGGYIEVSYDYGVSWVNVINDTNSMFLSTENLYSKNDFLSGGINGFSGTSSDWIYSRIQWVWYFPVRISKPDLFTLRFHFISDSVQSDKDGWMIDNILLSYAELPGSIPLKYINNSKLEFFQNTTDKTLSIYFLNPFPKYLTLTIFNNLGQIVKQVSNITSNPVQIELQNLDFGLYFLRLENHTGVFAVQKLIIY